MSNKTIPNISLLRPSSLPKIAECPSFHPLPFEAGPAAQRGTLMDEAMRDWFLGRRETLNTLDDRIEELAEELSTPLEPGGEAVMWAVNMTTLLAGDHQVITDEGDLRVDVPGIPSGGTMDAAVPEQNLLIDLKSGQIRNYMEQMAAYAYGCMNSSMEDHWTAKLLFCDQRVVVTHEFTYEQSKSIVEGLLSSQNAPGREQNPCGYCGWCALKETCAARRELATKALSYANLQERWEMILDDPEELAGFLTAADILKDFVDSAKRRGVQHFEDGGELPGYSIVTRKGGESVDKETLVNAMRSYSIDPAEIIRAQGNISGKKFRALVDVAGGEVRESDIRTGPETKFIKRKPTKKTSA